MADSNATLAPMQQRNQMSLRDLCQKEGTNNLDKFDFVGRDGKKHLFFSLGKLRVIWASERAQKELSDGMAALKAGQTDKAKACFMNIQFAECKKPELPDYDEQGRSNWVPSLMVAGNKPNETITLTF